MQVVLLEKIRRLGNLGDKVNVKSGFGRNYLIPQGKAVFATEANLAKFEQRRGELEKKAQEELAKAEQRAAELNALTLHIEALASDEGKLYGSVGVTEIADAITAKGIEVQRREVRLPEGPIHTVGQFDIEIQVHSDVVATIKIDITAAKTAS